MPLPYRPATTATIGAFLEGQRTTGFRITDAEFLALQFRKIIELIALSSLSAHRHEYEKVYEHFRRHWKADRIVVAIEKITPDFYPKPGVQVRDPETGKATEVKPKKDGFLTKPEFIEVLDECSDLLHAENPYYPKRLDLPRLREKFARWRGQIIALLNHHQVQLVDPDRELWVVMHAEKDGKVHVAEMLRVGAGNGKPAEPNRAASD